MTTRLKLLATLALAVAALTATAAKKIEVKVTNYNSEPIFGYWVEYEINGIKYRSDKAPIRINQIAWENMSDADRQTTVESVYGVFNAREEQFGSKAGEMGYWYDKKKGWVEGAEILTDSLIKRDFPDLYENFHDNKFWNEIKPELPKTPEIEQLYKEAELCWWDWARSAYVTIRNAAYVRTAAGVKSISGGLIELITDKVLVPNITPAGAGGIAAQLIGTALDYVNNIANIQSGIINTVVAKRPTTEQTLEAIKRCDMVISESRLFIAQCIQRIADLKKEIKERNEQFEKALEDADNKANAQISYIAALIYQTYDEYEPNPEIVAHIESLLKAIEDATKLINGPERLEKLEAAQNAYESYMTNKTNEVLKRLDEWRVDCLGREYADGTTNVPGSVVGSYLATFSAIEAPTNDWNFTSGLDVMTSSEAAALIKAREEYIRRLEEYYAERSRVAAEANEALPPYVTPAKGIRSDADALGLDIGQHMIVGRYGPYVCPADGKIGCPGGAWNASPRSLPSLERNIRSRTHA